MTDSNLERRLAESLSKDFDESFRHFCTSQFDSRTYPGKNLAAARMYLHYLKASIEALAGLPEILKEHVLGLDYPEDRGEAARLVARLSSELLEEDPDGNQNPSAVSNAIALYSYGATAKNKEDVTFYHTLFVESWLEFYSRQH